MSVLQSSDANTLLPSDHDNTRSSFQEKMPLGTPKKRVKSKKSFHLSSKKSGARVTCNCSGRKHQSAAAG
jgi:hypothetical protein